MTDYILAYHNGEKPPPSPEEGAKDFAKWKVWLEGLGAAVVNPGTPLGKSMMVSTEGVSEAKGTYPLTGFSIVKADTLEAALEMAKACPYLDMGTIEVAEMKSM